ncbi:MAG: AmmeMemoRadiSam system protein B [Candidatus Sumerlaeaceae bacterium]|nr:AmmeMemoRadiSam system protein B [Candidatus Sumerlaeaceae bacterium]
MSKRPAICAGPRRFYPSDPRELREVVEGYLASGGTTSPGTVGLVAPHAGYVFSGATAGQSFAAVRGLRFDRVVVMGPSHFVPFDGVHVTRCNAFETPLGRVPVDLDFVRALEEHHDLVAEWPQVEAREHCIEVELPFLQVALGEFRLVPIVVANQGRQSARVIAEALSRTMASEGGSTLVVASCDLYHGPGSSLALSRSRLAAEAMGGNDADRFLDGIEHGRFMACGPGAVAATMWLAGEAGADHAEVRGVTTSFEVYPVSEDYVVGYSSVIFREGTPDSSS